MTLPIGARSPQFMRRTTHLGDNSSDNLGDNSSDNLGDNLGDNLSDNLIVRFAQEWSMFQRPKISDNRGLQGTFRPRFQRQANS